MRVRGLTQVGFEPPRGEEGSDRFGWQVPFSGHKRHRPARRRSNTRTPALCFFVHDYRPMSPCALIYVICYPTMYIRIWTWSRRYLISVGGYHSSRRYSGFGVTWVGDGCVEVNDGSNSGILYRPRWEGGRARERREWGEALGVRDNNGNERGSVLDSSFPVLLLLQINCFSLVGFAARLLPTLTGRCEVKYPQSTPFSLPRIGISKGIPESLPPLIATSP